jgi:hypothetical protein
LLEFDLEKGGISMNNILWENFVGKPSPRREKVGGIFKLNFASWNFNGFRIPVKFKPSETRD